MTHSINLKIKRERHMAALINDEAKAARREYTKRRQRESESLIEEIEADKTARDWQKDLCIE